MTPLALLSLASLVAALSLPFSLGIDTKQTNIRHLDYNVQSCACAPEARYFTCESPMKVANTSCCYEDYGIIMQTQFWDFDTKYLAQIKGKSNATFELGCQEGIDEYEEENEEDFEGYLHSYGKGSVNTSEVFTIHGLWNDLCNGSYNLYCNMDLVIPDSTNLTGLISKTFERPDLYKAMTKYWINSGGSNVLGDSLSLWQHEYNKHGTCFNTMQPKCFVGPYNKYQAALAYYQKVLEVWNTLPTYKFLKAAGITPSVEKPYALSDIEQALKVSHDNKKVYIGCRNGTINEIWYYYQVRGSALTGDYVARDSLTNSLCPKYVWYLPK